VIVDGYHFGADYQQVIKQADLRLLFVDDYGHASHYYADLVLDQNICADESLYRNRQAYTQLLLGTRYVLLRREFWSWRDWRRKTLPIARRVLITLGGTDPGNATPDIIRAFHKIDVPGLEIQVLAGPLNPCLGPLEQTVMRPRCKMQLLTFVKNMPELMVWADIAVIAAGGTLWEMLFLQVPVMTFTYSNEAQEKSVERLSYGKVVYDLGNLENFDEQKFIIQVRNVLSDQNLRHHMSVLGSLVVDGQGTARILEHLRPLSLD